MKNRGAVARYLRIGEQHESPNEFTQLRPGELGSTGGAVARYLKIERRDRPVTEKAASAPKKEQRAPKQRTPKQRAPKSRRPAKKRQTIAVIELDAADVMPVVAPVYAEPEAEQAVVVAHKHRLHLH